MVLSGCSSFLQLPPINLPVNVRQTRNSETVFLRDPAMKWRLVQLGYTIANTNLLCYYKKQVFG